MAETSNTSQHPKPVIGLLGAPGSGKSTVAAMFAELGCGVINADHLAHEAIQSPAVREQLCAWWGDSVLGEDGRVDRAAVGQVVFGDAQKLAQLEGLIHPLVHAGRARERQRMFADPACVAIVEDCPLLLETGLEGQCDTLVYIDCPRAIRLQRLADSRGWTEQQVQKREEIQLPLDKKRSAADYVVDNGEAAAQVREQVEHVFKQIQG